MTNKELYKQAFSVLHISDGFSLEAKEMPTANSKPKFTRLVACIAACVLIVGSATLAYATDFCGIRRTLQLWIQGDKTDVTIQFDGSGHYTMDYTNGAGEGTHQGGGGVAIDDNGNERAATEDELLEQLSMPDIQYAEDGSVWVYWFDQKVDITDKFENDICYVKLVNGDKTLYVTVKYRGGYASSPDNYQSPALFN